MMHRNRIEHRSSAYGERLRTDLFEMAAAYAFHICQNHPFIDGNKRVGLSAALVFLDLNGIRLSDNEEKLYDLMMDTAIVKAGELKFASKFRELAIK